MTKTAFTKLMAAILAGAMMTLGLLSCGMTVRATDLMEGIEASEASGKAADDTFISALADFSVKLYQQSSVDCSKGDNFLISPISAAAALGMAENGAGGSTKAQFEALFGLTLDEINAYMLDYLENLYSSEENMKLSIANSIWFDEGRITVSRDFLAANKAYYRAQMYQADFSDPKTVSDINTWVKKNTDGMIEKLLEQISPETVMYIINAVCFDAQWAVKYEKSDILDGTFYNADGSAETIQFLRSEESRYISSADGTRGMIKNYKGGKFAFAALLPDEDTDIADFVAGLDGQAFLSLIQSAEPVPVNVVLPKFTYDCDMSLVDSLQALGLTDAFGAADFSGISKTQQLAISDVIHKTHIELDENGTKAAAVTAIIMDEAASAPAELSVTFDRPFVYAIIDTATGLPLFLGTVTSLGE